MVMASAWHPPKAITLQEQLQRLPNKWEAQAAFWYLHLLDHTPATVAKAVHWCLAQGMLAAYGPTGDLTCCGAA
jgi:hypothetical protein